MPRSGTSWLAQILASHPDTCLKLCPLFSYEFKNALGPTSSKDDWHDLFARVYSTKGQYLDQDFLRKDGLVPRFAIKSGEPDVLVIKSNRFHDIVAKAVSMGVDAKFLFIVRDPISTISSWLFNPMEFPEGCNLQDEWRTGACRKTAAGEYWGFEDWKYVTSLHQKLARQYPEVVRLISYEALLDNLNEIVEEVFDWIGLDVHEQTQQFLVDSRSQHDTNPRSVFKSPDSLDTYRERLPAKIQEAIISELDGTELQRFLRTSTGQGR